MRLPRRIPRLFGYRPDGDRDGGQEAPQLNIRGRKGSPGSGTGADLDGSYEPGLLGNPRAVLRHPDHRAPQFRGRR